MSVPSRCAPIAFRLLLIVIVGFAVARFVHLDADFPRGLTTYGVLYTDEGWYSNAAINDVVFGHWHIAGDFTPAVNLPVGPIVQRGMFAIFGMSLTSARATTALAFLVMLAATFQLARRLGDRWIAGIAASVIATNYVMFAYSRLAILETLMLAFVTSAMLVAASDTHKPSMKRITSSSLLLTAAVLVKTSALVALPALIYVAIRRASTRRARIMLGLLAAATVIAIVGAYAILTSFAFPADTQYFKFLNIDRRVVLTLNGVAMNFSSAVLSTPLLDGTLSAFVLIGTCVLLVRDEGFRRCPLVRTSLLLVGGQLALLAVTSYQPDRYFVPLLVPLALLFGVIVMRVREHVRGRLSLVVQCIAIMSVLVPNALRIVSYMAHPHFSFVEMTRDVRRIVAADPGTVVGNFANTVSLAAGMPTMNTLGPVPLTVRLAEWSPRYFLALGNDDDAMAVIASRYRLEHVRDWNVHANYYGGRKVMLFRIFACCSKQSGDVPSR